MHCLIRFARILLSLALLLLAAAHSFSFAEGTADAQYLAVDAGHYDLLRAHNQRMFVLFGKGVTFKRYDVVDIFNQYVPVASNVRGGVRYTLHETAGVKTLVID